MNSRYGFPRLVLKMSVWLLDTSISGRRVVRELGDLIAERGAASATTGDRTDLERGAGVVRRDARRLALYCAGQANAERVRRKIRRSHAR